MNGYFSTSNIALMLGTWAQVTNQDLVTYFTCELPAMNHLMLPRRETLVLSECWVSPGPKAIYTGWLSPGASVLRGITSDSGYLFVLVLRGGNSRELIEPRDKQNLLSHLALCDPLVSWLHCSLGKISFSYSLSEGGLWITSAPDPEILWLELNSQPAETQRCPALSWVSVLFIQPVP